jgi:hypothetical protein
MVFKTLKVRIFSFVSSVQCRVQTYYRLRIPMSPCSHSSQHYVTIEYWYLEYVKLQYSLQLFDVCWLQIFVYGNNFTMSSISKLLAGRRHERPELDFFYCNSETNKFKCNECAVLLSGKNPTNLTVYLSRTHKRLPELYKKVDEALKSKKVQWNAVIGRSSLCAKLKFRHIYSMIVCNAKSHHVRVSFSCHL